jgi:hypothetical protein
MRVTLFTLMAALAAAAASAAVYKWVDADGVIHYSDQPHENAEKVQLKALQTYSPPKTPPTAAQLTTGPSSKPATASPYQSCVVSQPENDQVFMNASSVTAAVSLMPTARPGDRLTVTMDGQQVPGVPATGGSFTISPVDRGTHSLQVVVQDPKGQVVCQSPAVTFHVHQPSLLNPVSPVKPK